MSTKTDLTMKTIIASCGIGGILWAVIVFLVWALASFVSAHSAELPISEAKSDAVQYKDIDSAVRGGVQQIPPRAAVEYGGSVVFCEATQSYVATPAVTADVALAVVFLTRVPVAFGRCEIVARYHSHPANAPLPQYFSPGDIYLARTEKIPVFMINMKTGELRVFTPGKSKTRGLNVSGRLMSVSLGDPLQ